MLRRATAFGALLVLAGCSQPKAAPRVEGLAPGLVTTFLDTPAVVSGRNFFVEAAASLNDDEGSVDQRFRVFVGDTALDTSTVTRVDNERLAIVVPAGMPVGVYDLTVVTPSGDSATLPDALTVVNEPLGLHVRVESAPGGAGTAVGATTLTADDTLALYAVGRDDSGAFVTDVPVEWNAGTLGTIESGPSTSATLEPVLAGVGAVTITNVAAESVTGTGPLTIVPGRANLLTVDPVFIVVNADDAGFTFLVTAIDADGNATLDLGTLDWMIDAGPITDIDPVSGVFTPVAAGTGVVRVISSHGPQETADVVVVPGQVAGLTIAPATRTFSADDGAFMFGFVALDADGNVTTDTGTLTWSVASGPITSIDPGTGAFTPTAAGSGTLGLVSDAGPAATSGEVVVNAGAAAALVVAPDTLVIDADAPATLFTLSGTDADGNATANLGAITWSISSGPITAIDPGTGAFDPAVAGSGTVRATSSLGVFDDSGTVTVDPGAATSLAVAPNSLTINADDAATPFTVSGADADGNPTPDLGTITWSIASGPITAINPGTGSLDPVTAGSGTVRATSNYPGLFDESDTVTVVAGAAAVLAVAPDTLATTVGAPNQAFTVTGTDGDGNVTSDVGALTWSISSGTIASIAAGSGVFSPTTAGTGSVRATSAYGPFDDSGAIGVQSAANLNVAFTVPVSVSAGQTFTVTMTVTNSGQSGANAVAPSALVTGGSSAGTLVTGPAPAAAAIAGGTFANFTWTYTAGAAGTLSFSGSASGTDASTGNPVSSGAGSSSNIAVQTAAALGVTLSIPATVISPGTPFTVTMNVTNSGGAIANGVAPSVLTLSGTGAATFASGPSPASRTLVGGTSGSFSWTYTATTDGTIQFSGSASGTDANTGAPVASPPSSSNVGSIAGAALLVSNPFAEGSAFAFVTGYAGKVYLGPRADGGAAVSHTLAGSNLTSHAFSFPTDTTGNLSTNLSAAPFPSVGAAGCTPNTNTLPGACGPDNEDGRGTFASGSISGTEWLLLAGARSAGTLEYVYMTRSTGATLAFRYVDLSGFLVPNTRGTSSIHFFNDSIYLGFAGNGGSRPFLARLQGTPPIPGLDAAAGDARNLEVDKIPGFKTATIEIIDSMIDFNNRVYLTNKGSCVRGTVLQPGDYASSPADWAFCTPSNPAYGAKVSRTTTVMSELEPSDKSVPQMAVYNGRLYLARNTTTGPQIWACTPGISGDATQCDPGDWSQVAANSAGDTQLSQFNNPNNTDITLLVATPTALFVGYNNATDGVVVFRSTAAAPLTRADFRGQGCPADNHPGSCSGVGGNGFGDATNVRRIYDGKALTFGSESAAFVSAGRIGGAVRVYRLSP